MLAPRRGPIVTAGLAFNSVKVFSGDDRAQVDRLVETWLARHPTIQLVDSVITESSTHAGTCVCITLFYFSPYVAAIDAVATN